MNGNRKRIIGLICGICIVIVTILLVFVTKQNIKSSNVGIEQKTLSEAGKVSTIKIVYVDNDGNTLFEDSTTGNVGEWYTTSRKSIEGYSAFGDEPLNKNGYFTDQETIITYVYQKGVPAKTTINEDNQVYIDINNHKSIREYQMRIKSVYTDNGQTENVDGAQYKISKDSEEIKVGNTKNGELYVGTITVRNETTATYTIEEIDNAEGYIKKVKNPFDVKVIKTWNEDLAKYEASLEYDNSVEGVNVELNENDEIIVTFEHEKISSKYSMSIVNVDEATGNKIDGAEFKVTKANNEFVKEVKIVSGIADVGEFEVSKETNTTETYYIEQLAPADGYNNMMDKSFELQVTKVYDSEKGVYNIELAYDTSIANVSAELDESGNIIIKVVSNKENIEQDLAIKYFITSVDSESKFRAPTAVVDENGNVTFTESKEVVNVANNQEVTLEAYLYNLKLEDTIGELIKIDIPNGFKYDETNETNLTYNWKMYKKNESGLLVKTEDASEAQYIISDYLDGKTIPGFNYKNSETPNHESVKAVFTIDEKNLAADRKITNTAEVIASSDDINKDNNKSSEYLYVNYFDLSIEKFIESIDITTDGVTEKRSLGIDKKDELVKIDVASKKVDLTQLNVLYGLKVSNIGEIPGRALEVTDYLPEGFTFNAEKNPDWYLDGNIVKTTILNNEILNPGESKIIYVTLDCNLSKDSMGKKVNNAEISLYYNKYDAQDVTDDNTDSKEILVTIKTGAVTYTLITLAILSVVLIVVFTKKQVLKERGGRHGK